MPIPLKAPLMIAAALCVATPALAEPWRENDRYYGRPVWDHHHGHGHGHYRHHGHGHHRGHGHHWKDRRPDVVIHYHQPAYAPRPRGYVTEVIPVPIPVLPAPPAYVGYSYGEPYRTGSGQFCREYQTQGMIGGRLEQLYGTACLQPDGSWSFR